MHASIRQHFPFQQALEAPRIALLFLTTRRLAHERLWRLWLWDAAHLVPRQALPAVQVRRMPDAWKPCGGSGCTTAALPAYPACLPC